MKFLNPPLWKGKQETHGFSWKIYKQRIVRFVVTDLGHQFELNKVRFHVFVDPPTLEFIFGIKFFDLCTSKYGNARLYNAVPILTTCAYQAYNK